jgi:hypothetical protein
MTVQFNHGDSVFELPERAGLLCGFVADMIAGIYKTIIQIDHIDGIAESKDGIIKIPIPTDMATKESLERVRIKNCM